MCYLFDCFLNAGLDWVLQVFFFRTERNRGIQSEKCISWVGLAISSLFDGLFYVNM